MLLHELRRKFVRVAVDLPRGASPLQRVVLAAASQVVVFCERSLAGLRDTIRLQSLVRDQAAQARLWLVDAGVASERAVIGKGEFEKGIGKAFDTSLPYDPKSAGAAANSGQPLPAAAPRSAHRSRAAPADRPVGRPREGCSETPGLCAALIMVAFFKRPAAEDTLDARIAVTVAACDAGRGPARSDAGARSGS